MKKRRIFIAFPLPGALVKKLLFEAREYRFPVRWLSHEDIHLTLLFLGYLTEDDLAKTCRIVNDIAKELPPFKGVITNILLGPDRRHPKMIWALGQIFGGDLNKTKQELHARLVGEGVRFKSDSRSFLFHITLSRFFGGKSQKTNVVDALFEKIIHLPFLLDTISVYESHPSRAGARCSILSSYPLQKEP